MAQKGINWGGYIILLAAIILAIFIMETWIWPWYQVIVFK